jgi:hypothetical protein
VWATHTNALELIPVFQLDVDEVLEAEGGQLKGPYPPVAAGCRAKGKGRRVKKLKGPYPTPREEGGGGGIDGEVGWSLVYGRETRGSKGQEGRPHLTRGVSSNSFLRILLPSSESSRGAGHLPAICPC